MRLYVIGCEVLFRELCYAAATSASVVDLELLPKGLHDDPSQMRGKLQALIDRADPRIHSAVVLGYALCSNGIVGVQAPPQIELIVPRAHDCITFFLGSKDEYSRRFRQRPGTYYYSAGWIERDFAHIPWAPGGSEADQARLDAYIAKYGEDNGRYLYEFENQWQKNYTTAAYIQMRLSDRPELAQAARQSAQEYGWEYEEIAGDDRLFTAMMAGNWDQSEFLVVPPGGVVAASPDERIVKCGRIAERAVDGA